MMVEKLVFWEEFGTDSRPEVWENRGGQKQREQRQRTSLNSCFSSEQLGR